ncbi:MAG: AMIN domain-containing protein, partial [Sedimenticola sp.]
MAAENVLKDISFSTLPGNSVRITLTAEGPVGEPRTFTTENPARIAMDFYGMSSDLAQKNQTIGVGMARSVTAIEAGGRTRVVVSLVSDVGHSIEVQDNKVFVTVAGGGHAAVAQAPAPAAEAQPSSSGSAPMAVAAQRSVENIDFRRGPDGEGRIQIMLNDASAVVDMREEGGRIVLDILDTALPERLMRKFDVSDFATPVQLFEVSAQGSGVHVNIRPEGH